ncbi:OmpA family protein, partial [Aurantimonas sp. A2-1-M11]|uniref:OmpA family protein n=1 Tax=Aurantimonas sp. A2-1-M11 TaxID=3113712 RepID=UPI002F9443DC
AAAEQEAAAQAAAEQEAAAADAARVAEEEAARLAQEAAAAAEQEAAAQAAAEQEAAAADAARVAEEEAARLAQEAAAAAEQEAAAQAAAEEEAAAAEAARIAEEEAARLAQEAAAAVEEEAATAEAARIKAEAAAEAVGIDAEKPLDAREERRRERESRRLEPAGVVEQPAQIAPVPSQPGAGPLEAVPEAGPQEVAPASPAPVPVGEAVPAADQPTGVREERRLERERQREERREGSAGTARQPNASDPSTVAAEPVPAESASPPTGAPADAAAQSLPAAGQPATAREERRQERERRRQERNGAPNVSQPSSVTAPLGASPVDARDERRRARELRRENRDSPPARTIAPAAAATTTVEQQLQIQGGSEELDELRRLQRKLERQREQVEASQSDDGFETGARSERRQQRQERRRNGVAVERLRDDDRAEWRRERRNDPGDRGEIVERQGDRIIIRLGDQLIIQPEQEGDRLLSRARDVEVEDLGNGETLTTVYRGNGVRVQTVRDVYGNILLRTRVLPNGQEIVLIDNLSWEDSLRSPARNDRRFYAEIGPLPPLVVAIPQDEYIVETRAATPLQVEAALTAPPVEDVERIYSLDEVRYSDRLRDKVRRVDLDTITFAFGSAVVGLEELDALDSVGLAIEAIIAKRPDDIFLIEGHTDAVGSDEANLLLSDRRAEAVAVALSEDFDIPPENLVTQGYGEQHLKIETKEAERENRRVALRRITPLIRAAR